MSTTAVVGGLIGFGLFGVISFVCGYLQGKWDTQRDAVKHNVAEWQPDVHGMPDFVWRDSLYAKNQELTRICANYREKERAAAEVKQEET